MSAGHVLAGIWSPLLFKSCQNVESAVNKTVPEICTENTVFVLQNLHKFYINAFTEFYLTYVKCKKSLVADVVAFTEVACCR